MSLLTPRRAPGHTDTDHSSSDADAPLAGSAPFTASRTDAQDTAASELTHLLFDRDDRTRLHGPWRNLLTTEMFRHRPGLPAARRTALAYDRLRFVNELVGEPAELARDVRLLASLHEWTGVVDGAAGTLAGIHYNLFLGSLLDHDRSDERDLSEFLSMRRTGTFLCTELAHGNDAAALRTTAELDRRTDKFVLNTPTPGAQKFMPNTSTTGGPKTALVAARLVVDGTDHGVFLFLTPLSDPAGTLPGIRIRRLPERTGHPVDHCLTSFDHVRLPREALLEGVHGRLASGGFESFLGNRRKRFLHALGRVTAGKLCMSAAAVGVTRAALSIAVRYSHHRHISASRTGERVPLARHRSHHGRLLEGLADAYAMTFLHRRALSRWAGRDETDQAEAERLVAIAKGWITWQARAVTIECRERCGAQGLFPVNGLADHPLNLEGTITAEGDNLVIWLKAASEMLFHRRTEQRPRLDGPPEEQSLTDPRFLHDLLADAEGLWRERARGALRQGPSGDPLGRWNGASSAAVEMVRAHAVLQAAGSLLEAAGHADGAAPRQLLVWLSRLFMLRHLAPHTGDLLAEGRMTADQVRALPGSVDEVIAGLAPHMMTLVEAFDLPGEFLGGIPLANAAHETRFDQIVDTLLSA
ncbi:MULTISPECIES: acyl-CoA dehydrogenase family protein [Streptomyces]|uniref:Acyl-CoA oxidase n=2 Tax=Streptomyces TaxID=1883 RepID=A0A3R7IWA6_9ACTN|nr:MULTISPECIES: acyl-CoA dehydrogenase [Streptomyces]AAD40800.1 acyl-CoA oxidase [Streptomyces fradiae]PQM19481.1 acyl-CoA oxidase [Streptomyces xinghaiensis]RKM89879.1 acyl-CoA oxidase [Streptomyces xinghaiensis]RNC68200.1 acyl-CoA oxidase [Streptomyces xinghaiensis]